MSPLPLSRLGAGAVAVAFVSAAICSGVSVTPPTSAFAEETRLASTATSPSPEQPGTSAPGTDTPGDTTPGTPGEAPTPGTETPGTEAPGDPGTGEPSVETPGEAPEDTPSAEDPAPAPAPSDATADPQAPVLGTSGNAGAHWPLVITEINGDNAGTDNFEYLEVTNTTNQAIDLTAAGIQLRYHTSQWNTGTVQPLIHLDGEADSPAVIPAGGVAVFWMNYAEGDSRRSLSKDQFREFYGAAAEVQVFRFGPQLGFANGGERGFSLTDAEGNTLTRAWVPADDKDGKTPWNAQFAVSNELGSVDSRLIEYDITGATANPTPGTITVEQVTSTLTKPTNPSLGAPVLQITEVAPDTANVSGSDAFEFIEIYNASNAPVNFGDYVLNYLTTDNDLTNPTTNSSTLWPAGPGEPIIQPGKTLVLWVQNPAVLAAGYDADRFNAEFGSDLVLGETLLAIKSAGMSNGGSRGLQLMTKSGHDISRAYYFNDAQTTPTTAIQYAWNPGTTTPMWSPADPAGSTQTMLGLEKPSPGSVSDTQVSDSYVQFPAAGAAPAIADHTVLSADPGVQDLALDFLISDDSLVRRVTLQVVDNLGHSETRNLTFAAADQYRHTIAQVDLFGKQWIEYTVIAGDGHQSSTLGPVRVTLHDGQLDPVRVNVTDGQYVSGQTPLVATSQQNDPGLSLSVDGNVVTDGVRSLEQAPRFAIEATATDAFFRNGIKHGDNVLRIFDEGYYDKIVTVDAEVPMGEVLPGEPLTIGVYAGTKAWPQPDVNENNDDFSFMNPRLALPDGRVLLPTLCEAVGEVKPQRTVDCPADSSERVNLTDNDLVYFLATFTIPDDAFNSTAKIWDSAAVADGEHVISASVNSEQVSRTVIVDNTAPVISSTIEDDTQYRGDFTIDASASDSGAGLDSVKATLNGDAITLPYSTSSLKLVAGTHTLAITATDTVGNVSTRTVTFTTPDEKPKTALLSPADGAQLSGDKVKLEAMPVSNVDDLLNVCFVEGYTFDPQSTQVSSASGSTAHAGSTDRGDATPLSAEDLAKLTSTDGISVAETSRTALPYQLFTVAVPEGAAKGADARVEWSGSANADAKVLMYVQNNSGKWEEVDRYVTTAGAATDFTLEAQVPVSGNVKGGKLTFLVQHSEGYAGADLSDRSTAVTPFNAGATPRDSYDFTLAWESDTQYYNKNEGKLAGTGGADTWYQHQVNIHDFVLQERENLNIQYMTHTGDIVDNYDQEFQWKNADAAYQKLDDAGLPYGVLAGNHDVGHFDGDYTNYSDYFGEARFNENPWYGGSYKDNRGHYDLVSAGGIDMLMLYMGWPDPNNDASNSADIAWMNSVIQQFPERKVMINLHEYMLTTGGLGPIPQRIYDEVVAPNSNVISVASGHYHDAYTRQDEFDDDGDGVADRTVYSMLFDYQGLAEGGQGFLRLMHFDNAEGKIVVRTYSPSRDLFNSEEPSLNSPPGMQEFEIPYAAGNLSSAAKTLASDSFRADILTGKTIACAEDVRSGEAASVNWNKVQPGEHSWYVRTTGPYGGEEFSEVRTFSISNDGGSEGGSNGGSDGGSNGGSNGGSDGGAHGGTDGGGAQAGGGSGNATGIGTIVNTGASQPWLLLVAALIAAGAGVTAIAAGRRKRRGAESTQSQ